MLIQKIFDLNEVGSKKDPKSELKTHQDDRTVQSPRQTQPLACPAGRPGPAQIAKYKVGPSSQPLTLHFPNRRERAGPPLTSPLASVIDLLCRRIRSRSPRRGVLRSAPPPPPLAGRCCIAAAAMVS